MELLRVIGGARLGEMTSVTISVPSNDSPLGRFGFQELEVSFLPHRNSLIIIVLASPVIKDENRSFGGLNNMRINYIKRNK